LARQDEINSTWRLVATATGLVITGTTAGEVLVFDAKTGAEMHKTNVNGGIGGGVITYQAGDRQFIAVAAGDNNSTYGTKGKNTIVVLGVPK
jgi:alcohol dehydrogenase (cytochrome c)